jgi:hypothetical protein
VAAGVGVGDEVIRTSLSAPLLPAPFALTAGPRARRHRRHAFKREEGSGAARQREGSALRTPRCREVGVTPRRSWQKQSRAVAPITRFRKRAAAGCCLTPKRSRPGRGRFHGRPAVPLSAVALMPGATAHLDLAYARLMLYEPPRETSACSSPARACVSKHLGALVAAAAPAGWSGSEATLRSCRGASTRGLLGRCSSPARAARRLGVVSMKAGPLSRPVSDP